MRPIPSRAVARVGPVQVLLGGRGAGGRLVDHPVRQPNLGFSRIVASETEVPNMLANLV